MFIVAGSSDQSLSGITRLNPLHRNTPMAPLIYFFNQPKAKHLQAIAPYKLLLSVSDYHFDLGLISHSSSNIRAALNQPKWRTD